MSTLRKFFLIFFGAQLLPAVQLPASVPSHDSVTVFVTASAVVGSSPLRELTGLLFESEARAEDNQPPGSMPSPAGDPAALVPPNGVTEPAPTVSAIEESSFLKIQRDASNRPTTMSTSIVHFRGEHAASGKNAVPIEVDLVSAVHIAEPEYYAKLNQRFAGYDVVLYELIAPDDLSLQERKALQTRSSSANPVSALQQTLQKVLGLAFQLESIDYSKANFVHADLSPEGFAASLQSHGDSIWTLFARLLMQGFVEEKKRENPLQSMLLLMAFATSSDTARPYVLRRYLAENFGQLDTLVEKIEGPKGSTLVADRNRRAIEVLRVQLAKGKRKFAIFYGAAHMPRFQDTLEKEFKLKRVSLEWIPAWHLQPQGPAGAS